MRTTRRTARWRRQGPGPAAASRAEPPRTPQPKKGQPFFPRPACPLPEGRAETGQGRSEAEPEGSLDAAPRAPHPPPGRGDEPFSRRTRQGPASAAGGWAELSKQPAAPGFPGSAALPGSPAAEVSPSTQGTVDSTQSLVRSQSPVSPVSPATAARQASPATPATPAFPANPRTPGDSSRHGESPQSGSRVTAAAAFPQQPSRLRVVVEVGRANRGGRSSPSGSEGYSGEARQDIRGSATRYSWLAGPSATRYSRHPRRDIRGNLPASTGAAKRLQPADGAPVRRAAIASRSPSTASRVGHDDRGQGPTIEGSAVKRPPRQTRASADPPDAG